MGTKKDVFTINKLKISCKFMSINNKLFNSTLDRMDKRIGDFIGENAVLKHEVDELKKSLQFHTDQWEENFKTLDNLKNELLQNQKHQKQHQQPVIQKQLPEVFCEKRCPQKFHKIHRKTTVPETLF